MAIGDQLTSQVVHDLRNPLSAVTSGLYLLTLEEELPAGARETVESCLAQAKQMAERLRQVARPFRPEPPMPRLLPAKDLVAAAVASWQARSEPNDGTIEIVAEAENCEVLVDGPALTMALAGLVGDAVVAAGKTGKVAITIRELPRAEVERRFSGPAVDVVSLLVSNSGRGFAPEEVAGAFEPLRIPGRRGGGVELAGAMIVVENHGGRIEIESRVDGGAYEILLPAGQRSPCWAWPDKSCEARCSECELDQAPEGVCCWALRACPDADGVADWPQRCRSCSYFDAFVLAGRRRGGAE